MRVAILVMLLATALVGCIQGIHSDCPIPIDAECVDGEQLLIQNWSQYYVDRPMPKITLEKDLVIDGVQLVGNQMGLQFDFGECDCNLTIKNGDIRANHTAILAYGNASSIHIENVIAYSQGYSDITPFGQSLRDAGYTIVTNRTEAIRFGDYTKYLLADSLILRNIDAGSVNESAGVGIGNGMGSHRFKEVALENIRVIGYAPAMKITAWDIFAKDLRSSESRGGFYFTKAMPETRIINGVLQPPDLAGPGALTIRNLNVSDATDNALLGRDYERADLHGVWITDSEEGIGLLTPDATLSNVRIRGGNYGIDITSPYYDAPSQFVLEDVQVGGANYLGIALQGREVLAEKIVLHNNGLGWPDPQRNSSRDGIHNYGGLHINGLGLLSEYGVIGQIRNSSFLDNVGLGLKGPEGLDATMNYWNSPDGPSYYVRSDFVPVPVPAVGRGDAVNLGPVVVPFLPTPP